MLLTLPNTSIDYQKYRSILCLNGALPSADFFKSELPIIAADGAANTLMEMGIKPDLVIGDLDAIDQRWLKEVETLYVYDQNFCDYEKSLDYLASKNLLPCIVVGINGGYLDHVLNNINIFMKSKNLLYAPPLYGCVVREDEHQTFNLPIDTKISLMGIPKAKVTTKGLKWELIDSTLSFPGVSSCFNRGVDDIVEIRVHEGSVLVLIYFSVPKNLLTAFIKKSKSGLNVSRL